MDVSIDNELGKTQNFTAQVKRVSKTKLFLPFCCESLDRLKFML